MLYCTYSTPHLHCCIILWANHYLLLYTYPFPPLAASIRHSVSITLPHICKSIFHMVRVKILYTLIMNVIIRLDFFILFIYMYIYCWLIWSAEHSSTCLCSVQTKVEFIIKVKCIRQKVTWFKVREQFRQLCQFLLSWIISSNYIVLRIALE